MSSRLLSTFSVVLLVLGRYKRLSSSTDTRPTFKRDSSSESTVRLEELSPKASRRILRVSVADLSSFAQNFMHTHCSNLSSIADNTKHEVEKPLM
jgi:hypothetical protein